MDGKKPGWSWRRKLAVSAGLVLVILVAPVTCFRRPWIEPISGVRVEPLRPVLAESDFGPGSPYRLLLKALEEPIGVEPPPGSSPVWHNHWYSVAFAGLAIHPWPTEFPSVETVDRMAEGSPRQEDRSQGIQEMSWTLAQYRDVQRLMKLYEPQLILLDKALADTESQVPASYAYCLSSPDLPTLVETMAQCLSVFAQCRAAQGDISGGFHDIARVLAMANMIRRGGSSRNHMAAGRCDQMAAETAWRILLRQKVASPLLESLARDFLAMADSADPFAEGIRVDSRFVADLVPLFYRYANLNPFVVKPFGWSPSLWQKTTAHAVFLFAPLAGSTPKATTRNIQAWCQHVIATAERDYTPATVSEYLSIRELTRLPRQPMDVLFRVRDPFGRSLVDDALPGSFDGMHRAATDAIANARGMALFLAIHAYLSEHGQLPEHLEQLVPDYLPCLPLDPYGREPFRYLRENVPGLPPTAWAVYSVGSDCWDNGGTATRMGSAQCSLFFKRDLVWPSQEYPGTPDELP